MYSQNFYTFFRQVDIFHTTECHIYIFLNSYSTHLSKLGRSPEKFENDLKLLKHSSLKFCFLKRHCVVSRSGILALMIKNNYSMLLSNLKRIKRIYKVRIKR